MSFDFSKLLGRIKECGYTQEKLAEVIDKDKSTLSSKLNNKGEFKAGEIDAICKVLDISNEEIGEYFFCCKSLDFQTCNQSPRNCIS